MVIAPSNPPLSVWPLLATPGLADAIAAKEIVAVVSPLFGGRALKGPAASVMADLGLPKGSAGVLSAYEGLISHLVIDKEDADDISSLEATNVSVHALNTRIDWARSRRSLCLGPAGNPDTGPAAGTRALSALRR